MKIATCVKFQGGVASPAEIEQILKVAFPESTVQLHEKELELATHLATSLRKQGIEVGGPEDVEYAVTIPCKIGNRTYEVLTSFDGAITNECWDVFYSPPKIGLLTRLFRTEEISAMQTEMRRLSRSIDTAIREIKGVSEIRWYPSLPSNPDKNWSRLPELA